jgi:AraC family transcriptional activator FtrA
MAQNFSKPIQIKDLAKLSNLSRRGFHKAFRKSVGCSPGAYLRNMRIKYAKQLLTEHDMRLKEIALRCGFRSTNTFWVAFTRMTKVAPKKYQRTHRLTATKNRHCAGESPRRERLNLAITSLS